MRYVVIGAGAVGGTIAARLHAAGREVVVVARGAHLDAIRGRTQALAAAVGHKSALEVRRRSLTVMALKTDQLDLFEVASLAAVPPERIRSEMRGITLRSVRLAN